MGYQKDEEADGVNWYRRHDVWMFVSGMIFIAALVGAMFGFGTLRGWYAPSGYEHNKSLTSPLRFLPEPSEYDPYMNYTGRQGAAVSDLRARWYYWKNKPWEATALTRLFVWLCYVGHQESIWLVIYLAQLQKAESTGPKYSTQMNKYNWIAFGLNIFFHLMHLLQTHTTYDALAQDVVITSSQSSVIMLLVLVMLMEYTERGLFFGWPTLRHTGKASVKLRLNSKPIHLVRKYHGYAFAWAAIYTFWYHPMENTYGHALGFVYTWMFLLQGSMMYTKLHMNRWWRLTQEVWVTLHGGLVAVQTGGTALRGTSLWPMFVFGFLWMLALTQIFLLDFWNNIPGWARIFPVLICLGVTIGNYSWIPDSNGQTWVRMQEVIRIPAIYYLCVLFAWALLYFFMWIERKIKGDSSKPKAISKLSQGLYICSFLFVYAILVGLSAFFERGGVNIMMFVSMVLLIFVFIIGVCISFMFVAQIVPARHTTQKPSSASSSITASESSFKKTPPEDAVEVALPGDNPAYNTGVATPRSQSEQTSHGGSGEIENSNKTTPNGMTNVHVA